MEKKVFTNCVIYSGNEVLFDSSISVEEGVVAAVVDTTNGSDDDAQVVDLGGRIIAPAFIDCQVNGGGGLLFNDSPTLETLRVISKAHERFGTLNFCPTLISCDFDKIAEAVRAVAEAKREGIGVIGLHLEGPFLNPDKGGIHDKKYIREASDDDIRRIIDIGTGEISIVTVAPEAVTDKQISELVKAGFFVSLGHSNATCDMAEKAFGSGAGGVTHLYNAMSQLGSREPGMVGASFANPATWAGIIVDGHHVDYRCARIAKRIKGDRLCLVTDAMPPVGMPDAKYSIGGIEVSCVDGKCVSPDGVLAGSALDLATAVRNSVQKCAIPKDEAIRMATLYPARMLGVDGSLGTIAVGQLADFVVLNNQDYVEGIIRRGTYTSFENSVTL